MKSAVLIFPGSNRDRDMIKALTILCGRAPELVWHQETSIPDVDVIALPGGFSYGDYLRSGAIAARSPVLKDLHRHNEKGTKILGVCNGFQILTEAGLLPGALMRNAGLKFVCKTVQLEAVNVDTAFSRQYKPGEVFPCPVAHHDGNYFADPVELERIENENRVVFRYAEGSNPNGSLNNIAGILNEKGNVMGMMPHPENLIEDLHGGIDGQGIFTSLLEAA